MQAGMRLSSPPPLNVLPGIIHTDPGRRGLRRNPHCNLFTATATDLASACQNLTHHPAPRLAIVTGFFIPTADPPGHETDGPLGALFLLRTCAALGIPARIATDPPGIAAMRAGRPAWLEIAWPRPITVRRVELVFDTQLNGERAARFPTLVRNYELRGWGPALRNARLVAENDNPLRFRRHVIPPARLTRLRLVLHATWGSPYAAVYALRAYSR